MFEDPFHQDVLRDQATNASGKARRAEIEITLEADVAMVMEFCC